MKEKIKIIVPCKNESGEDLLIDNFILNNFKHPNYMVHYENKKGLPELYNEYICEEFRNCIIIFVHDDVRIDDGEWYFKLEKCFNEGYSVVGLAGNSNIDIKKPTLWHLMNADNKKVHSGAVAHPYGKDQECITVFGPYPQRVVLLDGLFLAVKVRDILDKGIKFDEKFKFHHYDLDFSLQCHKNGLKLTTCGIYAFHQSPGLRSLEDIEWNKSQDLFLEKWNK